MIASEKVRNLIESYENLSEQERHEFVRLVVPLDGSPVSAEWNAELHQRADEIDSGTVELIHGEDFLRRWRNL
jgi:Putative addiction module component